MEIENIKNLLVNINIKWRDELEEAFEAERYYRGKNDILYYKKVPKPWVNSKGGKRTREIIPTKDESEEVTNVTDYDKEDDETNPLRDADNRIASHFYNFLVEQKATYLFGNPVSFDTNQKSLNETISKELGGHWRKICKNLCINASNCKVGWIHHWLDQDGSYHYGIVDSKQIYAFWGGKLNQKLLLVVRRYDYTDDIEGKEFEVIEYWDDEKCMAFEQEKNGAFEHLHPYNCFRSFNIELQEFEESNVYYHGFTKVPFSAFFNNQFHLNDLTPIKGYIDSYDKVYSLFTDNLEDIQRVIFIFENLGGASIEEMLHSMRRKGGLKVINDEYVHTDLRTIAIEIPTDASNDLLNLARKNIFEQGQGVDPSPENYAGNTSGEALKFMYANLEQKCAAMKDEFEVGFEHFLSLLIEGLHLNIEAEDIEIIWGAPTKINNTTEAVTNVKNSSGIVSNRTLLLNHPFVEDIDEELEQLEKEKEESMETYPQLFDNGDTEDVNESEPRTDEEER